MEKAGYYIQKLHLCKVHKWYGMSCIVIWGKEPNKLLSYDRTYQQKEEDNENTKSKTTKATKAKTNKGKKKNAKKKQLVL